MSLVTHLVHGVPLLDSDLLWSCPDLCGDELLEVADCVVFIALHPHLRHAYAFRVVVALWVLKTQTRLVQYLLCYIRDVSTSLPCHRESERIQHASTKMPVGLTTHDLAGMLGRSRPLRCGKGTTRRTTKRHYRRGVQYNPRPHPERRHAPCRLGCYTWTSMGRDGCRWEKTEIDIQRDGYHMTSCEAGDNGTEDSPSKLSTLHFL